MCSSSLCLQWSVSGTNRAACSAWVQLTSCKRGREQQLARFYMLWPLGANSLLCMRTVGQLQWIGQALFELAQLQRVAGALRRSAEQPAPV